METPTPPPTPVPTVAGSLPEQRAYLTRLRDDLRRLKNTVEWYILEEDFWGRPLSPDEWETGAREQQQVWSALVEELPQLAAPAGCADVHERYAQILELVVSIRHDYPEELVTAGEMPEELHDRINDLGLPIDQLSSEIDRRLSAMGAG